MRKISFILLFIAQAALAQDVHFSQFDQMLGRYNPATPSHIDHMMRFGLNYRMQWFNLPNKFSTIQLEGAYKIQEGKLKGLTTSLYFSQDMVTKTGLNTISFNIGESYPIKIKNHQLAFGVNLGLVHRRVDLSNRSFPTQWELASGNFNTAINNNENLTNPKALFFDMGIGVSWQTKFKNDVLNVGLGVFHINNPKDGIASNNARLDRLYNVHFAYKAFFKNRRFSLEPKIRYQYLSKASELNYGLELDIYLAQKSPEKIQNAVIIGILGRAGFQRTYDAISPLVGYRYQQFSAMLSYDLHVGKFRTDFGTSSSIELGLVYQIPSKKVNYYGVPCGIY